MPLLMKPPPWKCATCRQRAVSPAVITYSAEVEHDGRAYSVTVPDLAVHRCEKCGAVSLDDVADHRLSDALRHEAGLLTPAQIRHSREELGLTQKHLAELLQVSDSTLSRWETGAQIQQRCLDKLLRVFFDLEEVRRYLGAPASHVAELSR